MCTARGGRCADTIRRVIDTHCHLTYEGISERVEAVVRDAQSVGVDRMVSVGTSPDDAARAVRLAQQLPGVVFATAGLHPHHCDDAVDPGQLRSQLRVLAASGHLVALGEMGLDLHYDDPPLHFQQRAFAAQLELADEPALRHLPIIIHNRKATDATLAMLRSTGLPGERFLFHCFTGSATEVDAILDFGAWVGFTGIVTFKSAREVAEASDRVPLDRLVIETDAPYLTPEPYRRVKVNETMYLPNTAAFLAARRGMSLSAFTDAVDSNAERFYRLP